MALQPREKMLATATAGLLVVFVAYFAFTKVQAAFDFRHLRVDALRQEVAGKDDQVAHGKRARKKLLELEQRALPPEPQLARSIYQNWLLELVDQAKLQKADVKPGATVAQRGAFSLQSFTVRGQGTVEQLVRFLHDFYRQDYLHQARRVHVKPIEGSPGQFDITISIEAAAMPGAKSRAKLEEIPSKRLALDERSKYEAAIAGRKLFSAYSAPPPERETPRTDVARRPEFDPSKQAFVTGITEADAKPLVWVNVRTTGELLKLAEGDEFQVGSTKGTIGKIGLQEVEVLSGGKRWLIGVGKNLHEGRELPESGG